MTRRAPGTMPCSTMVRISRRPFPTPRVVPRHIRANRDLKAHAVRSGRKSCASLLDAQARGERASTASLHAALNDVERTAGRPPVEGELVESILTDLAREGFCRECEGAWVIV